MRSCILFLGCHFVLGELAFLSNPSLYYWSVGLVLASVKFGSFLCVISFFFMWYLFRMSLVFVYSISLVADPFLEAIGD